MSPSNSPVILTFFQTNNAVPNIRGGDEFGAEWQGREVEKTRFVLIVLYSWWRLDLSNKGILLIISSLRIFASIATIQLS